MEQNEKHLHNSVIISSKLTAAKQLGGHSFLDRLMHCIMSYFSPKVFVDPIKVRSSSS